MVPNAALNRNQRRAQRKQVKKLEKRMAARGFVIIDAPMMISEKMVEPSLSSLMGSQGLEIIELPPDRPDEKLSLESANQDEAVSVPLPIEEINNSTDVDDSAENTVAEDTETVASAQEPEIKFEEEAKPDKMSEPTPPSSVKETGTTETLCVQEAHTVTPPTEEVSDDIEEITVKEFPMTNGEEKSKMEQPKRVYEQTKKANSKLLPILKKITPKGQKPKKRSGLLGLLKKKKK
ncbi:hypothetical protein DFQ28_007744, partial [Apophysomyces sp. BC1034]